MDKWKALFINNIYIFINLTDELLSICYPFPISQIDDFLIKHKLKITKEEILNKINKENINLYEICQANKNNNNDNDNNNIKENIIKNNNNIINNNQNNNNKKLDLSRITNEIDLKNLILFSQLLKFKITFENVIKLKYQSKATYNYIIENDQQHKCKILINNILLCEEYGYDDNNARYKAQLKALEILLPKDTYDKICENEMNRHNKKKEEGIEKYKKEKEIKINNRGIFMNNINNNDNDIDIDIKDNINSLYDNDFMIDNYNNNKYKDFNNNNENNKNNNNNNHEKLIKNIIDNISNCNINKKNNINSEVDIKEEKIKDNQSKNLFEDEINDIEQIKKLGINPNIITRDFDEDVEFINIDDDNSQSININNNYEYEDMNDNKKQLNPIDYLKIKKKRDKEDEEEENKIEYNNTYINDDIIYITEEDNIKSNDSIEASNLPIDSPLISLKFIDTIKYKPFKIVEKLAKKFRRLQIKIIKDGYPKKITSKFLGIEIIDKNNINYCAQLFLDKIIDKKIIKTYYDLCKYIYNNHYNDENLIKIFKDKIF